MAIRTPITATDTHILNDRDDGIIETLCKISPDHVGGAAIRMVDADVATCWLCRSIQRRIDGEDYYIGQRGMGRKGTPWVVTGEWTDTDGDTRPIVSYGGTCVDCNRLIMPIMPEERPSLEDFLTGTIKPIGRAVMVTEGLCSDCAPELA